MESMAFSKAVAFMLSHCRTKSKSLSSGLKTGPYVARVCKQLALLQNAPRGPQPSPSKATPSPAKQSSSQQKRSRSPTAETSASKTPKSSSASSYNREPTAAHLLAIIGNASASRAAVSESPLSIASSPGPVTDDAPVQLPLPPTFVEQYLHSTGKMVRYGGGKVIAEAEMVPGSKGFLIARWPDGKESVTEIPNLVAEIKRRPAAAPSTPTVMKRPAQSQAIVKAVGGEEEAEEEEPTEPDVLVSIAAKYGCGKCRWGETGCYKCNPIKKATYLAKKNNLGTDVN